METNLTNSNMSYSTAYVLDTRIKIMMSIDIIFFIVGFFGNGSVIYLTLRHKGLRSIPNLMIANLAVGDMLVVILVIFVNVLHYNLAAMRLFIIHYCEFLLFVQFLSQGVSVLTLTALSVDRFTTVAFPLHKQSYARKLSIWTVTAIWATSATVLWPIFVYVEDSTCWFPSEISYTVYQLCIVFLLFVLPSAVMVVCYILTTVLLLRRKPNLKLDSRGGRKQQKKRSRLAVIVLIMTVTFILCSSLLYTWLVVFLFAPKSPFVRNMFMNDAKTMLLKLNSIINPVILYFMSSTYRRHLLNKIKFCLFPGKAKHRNTNDTLRASVSRITYLARQSAVKKDGDDLDDVNANGTNCCLTNQYSNDCHEQQAKMLPINEDESEM